MSGRITAIGVAVLMALLPLSVCCVSAAPHPCCEDRCAMAPDAAPVVALKPAAPRLETLIAFPVRMPIAHAVPDAGSPYTLVPATAHPRRNPVSTIQLRI